MGPLLDPIPIFIVSARHPSPSRGRPWNSSMDFGGIQNIPVRGCPWNIWKMRVGRLLAILSICNGRFVLTAIWVFLRGTFVPIRKPWDLGAPKAYSLASGNGPSMFCSAFHPLNHMSNHWKWRSFWEPVMLYLFRRICWIAIWYEPFLFDVELCRV